MSTDSTPSARPAIAPPSRQATIDVDTESAANARELRELRSVPTTGINPRREDVLGRALPDDPAEAKAQQIEAVALREQRVAVDVARAQRGLPPKYATK